MSQDLRLSYSLASQFEKFMTAGHPFPGDEKKLLNSIHGKPNKTSLAMMVGKLIHRIFEEETLATGKMPECLNLDMGDIKAEQRVEARLNDWCVMSGVMDAVAEDGRVVVDYKVGMGDIATYLGTHQKGCYKFLNPNLQTFMVIRYNPFLKFSPIESVYDYLNTYQTTALKIYYNEKVKKQREKEYKPTWFYYTDDIEVDFGDKLKNEQLAKDLEGLASWLLGRMEQGSVQLGIACMDEEQRKESEQWLKEQATSLKDWCEGTGEDYWRKFDRNTGKALTST